MVSSLYISLVFSFSCINRQLSFFILSLLLSTVCVRIRSGADGDDGDGDGNGVVDHSARSA
jgi:hypothetical protein